MSGTIGDVAGEVTHEFIAHEVGRDAGPSMRAQADELVEAICAALGVDPATPLDRLHVLADGQHVIEVKDGPRRGDVCLDEDGEIAMLMFNRRPDERRWVVVRSAGGAE